MSVLPVLLTGVNTFAQTLLVHINAVVKLAINWTMML